MIEQVENMSRKLSESMNLQKESILNSAFSIAVRLDENLPPETFVIVDTQAILKNARLVIVQSTGEEIFYYKDKRIATFFPPELHHEAGKILFTQKYKVHV